MGAKAAAREIGWAAAQGMTPPEGELKVTYYFYPPDRRWRDVTNLQAMMKYYQDGVFMALGIDDVLIRHGAGEKAEVREGGLVEMVIELYDYRIL